MATADVGGRLRRARVQRGLSLRNLAESLGVSASLLSQVETGKTQPSVSTLYALVTHLGISFDTLLGLDPPPGTDQDRGDTAPGAPPAQTRPRTDPTPSPTAAPNAAPNVVPTATPWTPPVQHADDAPTLEMENGVRWERLADSPHGDVDPLLVTYAPGASSSIEGRLMRHAGIEHAYLIEGTLTLQLEFDTHEINAGDSLRFDSQRPHLYTNHSDTPARGVWFVTGRRQHHAMADLMPHTPTTAPTPTTLTSAVDVLRTMDDMGQQPADTEHHDTRHHDTGH